MKTLVLDFPLTNRLSLLNKANTSVRHRRSVLRPDTHLNADSRRDNLRELTQVLRDGAISEYVQQQGNSHEGTHTPPRRTSKEIKVKTKALTMLSPVNFGASTEVRQYYIAHSLFAGHIPPSRSASRPLDLLNKPRRLRAHNFSRSSYTRPMRSSESPVLPLLRKNM